MCSCMSRQRAQERLRLVLVAAEQEPGREVVEHLRFCVRAALVRAAGVDAHAGRARECGACASACRSISVEEKRLVVAEGALRERVAELSEALARERLKS